MFRSLLLAIASLATAPSFAFTVEPQQPQASGPWWASDPVVSEVPSMSCLFHTAIMVKNEKPFETSKIEISQSMRLKEGQTTSETLTLDGRFRATNSIKWETTSNQTQDSTFLLIGDDGDLLSIEYGKAKNLNGTLQARLTSVSWNIWTQIRVGICTID